MNNSDGELFMTQMQGVTPLKNDIKKAQTHSVSQRLQDFKKRQQQNLYDELMQRLELHKNINFVAPDELLTYKKSGVQQGVFKNLRQNKYDIEMQINITNIPLVDAKFALIQQLTECHKRNIRVILLKHGFGGKDGSKKAILKSHVNAWLPHFEFVLAYHSAQHHHGGYSACYILLRKNELAKLDNKEVHTKK